LRREKRRQQQQRKKNGYGTAHAGLLKNEPRLQAA
jgi:hypothetical protein